jgi:hypothetical protein
VVFGPDFRLYVGSGDMDRLVMFLGNQYLGDFGGDDGVLFPFSLAFAPFRYKVKVNGIMTGGGQRQKVKGKGVLSIAPGSQTIMLDLQDDPDTPADYASLMGAERLVFHGLEGVASATERHRVLGGTEVKGPSYQDGVGSISLRVKGSLDEDGSYVPNRVKGWFHRSQGLQAVHLSMKVAKRLN